jgi:hypothetical protein
MKPVLSRPALLLALLTALHSAAAHEKLSLHQRVILEAKSAPPVDASFSFDAPAGPQFTEAEKAAQRERGKLVLPMVRQAFASGAAEVRIPPGDYRFGQERYEGARLIFPLGFVDLQRDAEHPFVIDATGATFWFDLDDAQMPPGHRCVGFQNCRNRVLWKKKLALRFASVDEDAPSFVKPSYNRNRRYYGTLTFTPFSQTSIRVHAEKTDYKANNPVTHFPWDWATPAYEAIRQNNLSLAPLTAENTLQPQYYTGDYQGPLKLYIDRSRQTVAGPGTIPFWSAKYGPALDPNTGINRITFSPENIHLFPVVAGNIGKNFIGDNTRIRIGSHIYNVFLEQQLGGGLSLELGAHQEKWDRKVKSIIGVWRSGYPQAPDRTNRHFKKIRGGGNRSASLAKGGQRHAPRPGGGNCVCAIRQLGRSITTVWLRG